MSEVPEGSQVRIVWPEDALWPQGGYANSILVNHTPWDFTLRLGHIVLPALPPGEPAPEGGVEVVATPIAQVTMPPQTLRQLALVLQEQVAKYIANYGEIGGGPPEAGIR
jgi:Protein of unknown function (DUF3467)